MFRTNSSGLIHRCVLQSNHHIDKHRSNESSCPINNNSCTNERLCILTPFSSSRRLRALNLTWSAAVHQSTQRPPVPPVLTEVSDGKVRHFVLDPAEQSLLGRLFLGFAVVFVLPDGHRDGVVEDQGPY